MQLYTYTAKDKSGEMQKGEIEAENENAAAKLLTSRELYPIIVTKGKEKSFSFFEHVTLKDKMLLVRQLATMINAGLPIAQSLKTLEEQVKKPNLKKILEQVSSDVEGGMPLSVAFSRFPQVFTQLDITLVSSGETSGSLDKALLRLADQLEGEQSLLRKVRGALIYPAFIIVVVIAVMTLMIIYVMPQMEALYTSFNASLPLLTRITIKISHFFASGMPFILLFGIAAAIFIRIQIQKPAGRKMWDGLKLKIYGFNELLKKIYMTRFSRTLSGLVASGVPLLDSLDIVSKSIGNVLYQNEVQEASQKVKSGVALSEALQENPLFPPVVVQMISVGEKTGELDKMLTNLADYFEEEVNALVKNLSNLIEPLVIVILGLIIGFLLIAVMMPIYGLASVLFK